VAAAREPATGFDDVAYHVLIQPKRPTSHSTCLLESGAFDPPLHATDSGK